MSIDHRTLSERSSTPRSAGEPGVAQAKRSTNNGRRATCVAPTVRLEQVNVPPRMAASAPIQLSRPEFVLDPAMAD
jgi:hypothetical protein